MSDLDLLRSVGDQLVPPPLDTLRETARARDRRTAQTGIAVAAVALLAVGATAFVTLGKDNAEELPPIQPSPTRPLTYADGSTIHYGDVTIGAPGTVRELDLTDDGVAFRTSDGRIWFSDGVTTDELGILGEPTAPGTALERWIPAMAHHYSPVLTSTGWVVSGNSGSNLAWFEVRQPDAPEIVVYDTHARRVVLRTEVTVGAGSWAGPHSVDDESAYLFLDPDPFADDKMPQVRVDLATGAQVPVTPKQYLADVGTRPARSILISHAEQGFRLYEITAGTGQQFDVQGGHLRAAGMQPMELRDGLTNQRLEMRAPAGYPNSNPVWLVQWLDDATVVLSATNGDQEDLLACPIPTGTCEVVVTGPSSIVVPDVSWAD